MDKMGKISHVNELAKFKVGATAYWVAMRPVVIPELRDEDQWIEEEHPKTLYERGYMKKAWAGKTALPKLHATDFTQIAVLLTSKLQVEAFVVVDVQRNFNTGEFYYHSQDGEWMPESGLFVSESGATKECTRIRRMISRWGKYGSVR